MNLEIDALEDQLKDAKTLVKRRDAAVRLASNRDFKSLILDEFCVQECARYAQNSANPALNASDRADSLAIAQAAGHLRRYLSVVVQMGAVAEKEIGQIEEAIDEARSEEGLDDGDAN